MSISRILGRHCPSGHTEEPRCITPSATTWPRLAQPTCAATPSVTPWPAPAARRPARRSTARRPASSPDPPRRPMTCATETDRRETMMAKTVTQGRRPDATAGTDAIYRSLFDSFDPDQDGRISPLEVLARLERSGLQPGDPRIAEVR